MNIRRINKVVTHYNSQPIQTIIFEANMFEQRIKLQNEKNISPFNLRTNPTFDHLYFAIKIGLNQLNLATYQSWQILLISHSGFLGFFLLLSMGFVGCTIESSIERVLCISIEKLGLVKVLGMLDGVGNNNVSFANVKLVSISVEPLPLASTKL